MIILLLLLSLAADPDIKRAKGLSPNVSTKYDELRHVWTCKSACYSGETRSDGGLVGRPITAEAGTEEACKQKLQEQANNGCKPK